MNIKESCYRKNTKSNRIKASSNGGEWAASRTKDTYLKSKYHSLVGRGGKKKAIIAVGHKILIAAYFITKDKINFNELGETHLTNYRKDKLIAYHIKQLEALMPEMDFIKVVD